jgi:hypothetical protein
MREAVSRRRFLRSTAAGLSALAMPAGAQAQSATQPPPKPLQPDEHSVTAPVAIEVKAHPLPSFDTRDRSHVRFGKLEYRSGLILTSPFPGFGGLSGLRFDAKGERFISFSDKGNWFTGRIVYSGRAMVGLDDVEAAPMLGPDGRPITARGWFDSESIALDGSLVYIGLGNLIAFLVGGPTPGQFSVRRTDSFDVSDAVLLASGDLLVLERKFSLLAGIGIRIRRIALASLAPGAVVDGPSVFDADLGEEIDNMEGIDAHVTPEGDTVLTMVSDDNFSLIQRTLLLQFTLVE